MHRSQGFTLIELMITITIAGIILAISVPWFGDFVRDYRSFSESNQLINTLSQTKSEAIKRSTEVSLELTKNDTPTTRDDWRYRWRVYLDKNKNNKFDSGETLIKEGQGNVELSIADTPTTKSGNIRFNAKGLISSSNIAKTGDNYHLKLCDSRREGIAIELNTIGRADKEKRKSDNPIAPSECKYN